MGKWEIVESRPIRKSLNIDENLTIEFRAKDEFDNYSNILVYNL